MNENDLMQRITSALEKAPDVRAPDDFASRVMARVPQQKARRRMVVPATAPARYGQVSTLLGMAILVVAMVLFAPQTRASGLWLTLQALLFAELATLVLWFGWLRRAR